MRELFLQPPRQKVDPTIPPNKPVFRILDEHGFFGPDDTLHPFGSIIVLYDEPNENMEPMNDMALKKMEEMLDKLEASAKYVAEKNGRFFAGRPRTKEEMLSAASEDARRAQTTGNPNGVVIMGAKMDTSSRIQQVGAQPVPETAADNKPKRAKIETISN